MQLSSRIGHSYLGLSRRITARRTILPPVIISCSNSERHNRPWTVTAAEGGLDAGNGSSANNGNRYPEGFASTDDIDNVNQTANFCIIESRDTVKDFEQMAASDLRTALSTRRNRIFLLMEEVRRLRIQLRMKGGEVTKLEEMKEERFMSALPFLPPLTQETLKTYGTVYFFLFAAIIAFGGLLAPILEVKLGLGGTSYLEFVETMGLPRQLAAVDPIVASFCGGSVGVLSALLVVEVNNIKKQQRNRCHYCEGTGYLPCGQCIGTGVDAPELVTAGAGAGPAPAVAAATSTSGGGSSSGGGSGLITMTGGVPSSTRFGSAASASQQRACSLCCGSGKVMCTGCLCTGKQMATEHDPRIDPFD